MNAEEALARLEIETPSWGYGNSGTRFHVYPWPGAARNAEERIADAGLVHRLTGCCPRVAIHIPWDRVDDYGALARHAAHSDAILPRAAGDGADGGDGAGGPAVELIEVPLHAVAHSRAGDKGNRANLSLMPYDPALWPALAEQVTEERVLALFAHRGATRCTRYDLPLIHAFNFIIDDALEGGVNGSLNLDGHGKSLSFRLLSLTVKVPADKVPRT